MTPLTELEGAVLSEIHHRRQQNAFQVRRAFQVSPSIEWSGSAGAVYPAVARLQRRGLIAVGEAADKRATRPLSLTAEGEAALLAWASDGERAASVGLDPFRLRSGIWMALPPAQRAPVLRGIAAQIEANLRFLDAYVQTVDGIEAVRLRMSMQLQQSRLEWIADALAKP
ncbi:helix-turn-helix transcriptional regulator [Lysobacter enzymogenes]|uniref:PadR family transcriptional regulator n=1 Tax=Lysobacter enzymogenes TaxID=69 RepID=UPI00374A7857